VNQSNHRLAARHLIAARIAKPGGHATSMWHFDGASLDGVERRSPRDLPCHEHDPDLWFAESPARLERAKALCMTCPVQRGCLASALRRREPWGVWGGEILLHGHVIPYKRGRGRPRIRHPETIDADRCLQVRLATAILAEGTRR
jgi:WhiB family transcriptional regulator, redox-sensing transcriptional regulator